MQAVDFDRARISWITKAGIDGSWRIIATACPKGSANCIYLAPAVMAGEIFGAGHLPHDPPYSYQLVATQERHAIVRESDAPAIEDSEADNEAAFSSFHVYAPRRSAKSIETGGLNSATLAQLWSISVRLSSRMTSIR